MNVPPTQPPAPHETRVYHRRRAQAGTVLAPGAPDTTWVHFDGEPDPVEVSTCLLEPLTTPTP